MREVHVQTDREHALLRLGERLRGEGYRFVTITPESHRRVLERAPTADAEDRPTLRDAFGWSRPFAREDLPPPHWDLLVRAGAVLETREGRFRSAVRYSTLGEDLFVHSAYPTLDEDAVFLGPDTYRFVAAARRFAACLAHHPVGRRLADVGCGTGAGGLALRDRVERLVLTDVNEGALSLARVNASLARARDVAFVRSDVLAAVDGPLDLVVANPPYLRDPLARAYRDGGGTHGEELALRILRESLVRLAPGGSLLLYTGAPVVRGEDRFLAGAMTALANAHEGTKVTYEELDPDVFGEELATPAYAEVERIAAVVLSATRA